MVSTASEVSEKKSSGGSIKGRLAWTIFWIVPGVVASCFGIYFSSSVAIDIWIIGALICWASLFLVMFWPQEEEGPITQEPARTFNFIGAIALWSMVLYSAFIAYVFLLINPALKLWLRTLASYDPASETFRFDSLMWACFITCGCAMILVSARPLVSMVTAKLDAKVYELFKGEPFPMETGEGDE